MPTTAEAIPIALAGFACGICAGPLTFEDFIDLGLRAPDVGEPREDYLDAELLDSLTHLACPSA